MKYKIVVPETWYRTIELEAASEEDAKQQFLVGESEGGFKNEAFDYSHTNVNEMVITKGE
jgi:hypothetical protein